MDIEERESSYPRLTWLEQVYHTRRMQRVFAVRFSGDASYVFSGSDDMNVRVWKVRGSCPVLVVRSCGVVACMLASQASCHQMGMLLLTRLQVE